MHTPRPLLPRYGLALGTVTLAALLTALLRPLLEPTPFLLFLLAVMAGAWYGGVGPGLAAAITAALATEYLFAPISPAHSEELATLRRVGIFVLMTVLIGWQSSARRRAEQRLRFLAEASNLLAASLDYPTTLAGAVRFAVPHVADGCLIDLLEDDGRLRTAAVAHADPERLDALRKLAQPSFPGAAGVIQSGRPQIYSAVSARLLADLARGPGQLDSLRELGLKSVLILPLIARGRTLGAISFISLSRRRRYRSADLARELASRVALALDNARLYQTTQEAVRRQNESLALLDTLLASAPVGLAFVDRQLRFVRINASLADMNGVPPQQTVGRPLAEVIPNLAAQVEPLYRRVLETGQPLRDQELSGVTAASAGQQRHWLVSYYPVSVRDGPPLGVGVVVADITERKRLEAELRQRAEALAETDRHKDEFLAILAHELRSPLAPLRHALQVMRLRGTDRRSASVWAQDMIERQVRHIVRLVDDLLDVSRGSRGKIRLRKEEVELAAVVGQAVQTSRPLMDARGHRLSVALPAAPVYLEADPTRLEQVLTNLLTNAAKYTNAGGQVWLSAEREAGEVVIRVKDTGVGIPADLLTRIFEPFIQAERSLEQSQGGLGIGLTLVRRLVELHGGSVTAHSAGAGQGSEFVVRLPVLTRAPEHPAALQPVVPATVPSRRVLVVDDNADTAESLAMLLRMWGHVVRLAPDGPTALEAAQADPPQIVLLDVGLPGMNGYEVAQRLRALPGLDQTLLVALTGYGQEEDRQRSRDAGLHLHLTKPVDLDELRRVLASFPGVPPGS